MAAVFFPAVRSLFPLENDLGPSGDDWWSYHRYAVSVVDGGLRMPAVEGPYARPGGFGYVYFVAALYAIFGVRSEVVYVAQALLLAGAVLGFVAAFRRRVPSLVYGVLLIVFVYLDVFRFYTFRLLSENLLIFLLALLFLAVERVLATQSWPAVVATAVLCGACFLVRPNTLLLAPALALVLFRKRAYPKAGAVVAGLIVFSMLIVWRDYAATGALDLNVLTTTRDWAQPSFPLYVKRVLYVFGWLHALVPEFGPLRHWLVAWVCVLLLALRIRRLDELDRVALVFLAAYYVPLIAVAEIQNYGIRMLVPAMPVVVYLGLRALTLLLRR